MKNQQFAQQMAMAFEAALREDADNLCLVGEDIQKVMKHFNQASESLLGHAPRPRGQSPYQYWKGLHKAGVAKMHPTATYKELSVILKGQWKAMSQEEQEPFVKGAHAIKFSQCEASPPHTPTSEAEPVKSKTTRKPRKKGRSPYQTYKAMEKTSFQLQYPDDDYSSLSKKMKEAWENLEASDQAKYETHQEDSGGESDVSIPTTDEEEPASPSVQEEPVSPSVQEEPASPTVEEEPASPSVQEGAAAPTVEEEHVSPLVVMEASAPLPPILKAKAMAKALGKKKFQGEAPEEQPTDKKSKRKPRVRGCSPYQAWKKQHRQQFTESNPDDDYSGLSKKMKDVWDALEEQEKAPYLEESKKVRASSSPVA
jgi:hypothetical protein